MTALVNDIIDPIIGLFLPTGNLSALSVTVPKMDASIVADLAGADLISKCYVPDKNIREIRTLIRHRIDLEV